MAPDSDFVGRTERRRGSATTTNKSTRPSPYLEINKKGNEVGQKSNEYGLNAQQRQRRKEKSGWSLLSLPLLFKFQRLYYYLFGNGLQLNSLNHHDGDCNNVVNAEMEHRPRTLSSSEH